MRAPSFVRVFNVFYEVELIIVALSVGEIDTPLTGFHLNKYFCVEKEFIPMNPLPCVSLTEVGTHACEEGGVS